MTLSRIKSAALSTALLSLFAPRTFHQCTAKEITGTNEWQLLQENDTIPAGLHVRLDLSTGQKWAKLPSDNDNEVEEGLMGVPLEEAVVDGSGALTIVPSDDNENNAKRR